MSESGLAPAGVRIWRNPSGLPGREKSQNETETVAGTSGLYLRTGVLKEWQKQQGDGSLTNSHILLLLLFCPNLFSVPALVC